MTSTTDIDPETRALLALQLVPGVGTRLAQALIARFGSAAGALAASADELRTVPRIGAQLAKRLAEANHEADIEKELGLLAKHQVRLARLGTPAYPASLAAIGSPPLFLYVRGEVLPADANAVAIVGSRNCTAYGQRMGERLATGLVRAGCTVISGLAYGIDAVAHKAALAAGGRTLAVLAGGLAKIYPADHADLADQVTAAGALLTEASMQQTPLRTLFPARNRIISGLSRGVIVVEAGERSGALITADHALKQRRPVFAVPGPADSEMSRGAHRLIKKGAILVRDVDDVLSELGQSAAPAAPLPKTAPPAVAPKPKPALTGNQQTVWNALGPETVHADDLVQRCGLSVGEVSHALLLMELQGLVRRLPGNRFERRG